MTILENVIGLTILIVICLGGAIGFRCLLSYTIYRWSRDAVKRVGATDDEAHDWAMRSVGAANDALAGK